MQYRLSPQSARETGLWRAALTQPLREVYAIDTAVQLPARLQQLMDDLERVERAAR